MNLLDTARQGLIDAHCHLASEEISASINHNIHLAETAGVSGFISTALTDKEYQWHLNNQRDNLFLTAGIHPHYEEESVLDLDKLYELAQAKKIWGIGEIGLDKRNRDETGQKKLLSAQLEIARDCELPVVFHIVGRYNELYDILKNSFPKVKGYIHGFTGSQELVNMLLKLNIGFSVGSRIFSAKHGREALQLIIANGFYFFETDAPYLQSSFLAGEGFLPSLRKIADETAVLTNKTLSQLVKVQYESFLRLTNS